MIKVFKNAKKISENPENKKINEKYIKDEE
jgi:hypothetical protein